MQLPSFTRGALAAAALLIGSLAIPLGAGAQTSDVGITINGATINLEPAPIVQDGRVFVPLRGVFENLGASVVYDAGTITATGNGRDIELHIGSTDATVNGQAQTIDVAPFIVGASTFVPLRFVSEALGANVNWDENNRIVAIDMAGANAQPQPQPQQQDYQSAPQDDDYDDQHVDTPPPPLPVYDQPPVPQPNELWQPGYWAYGPYGYFWVPGAWVAPPQVGYVWTPGYWGYNNGLYAFNQGYWATSVGFYGGVNYGAGYFGAGYVGGQWSGREFRYNTYVTHVNVNIVHNVYVNRTVYVNNSTTRISYNGGRGGLLSRPTAQQTQIMHAPHIAPTAVQRQHIQVAAQNRQFLASVNHNHPPVTAVAQPLGPAHRPAGFVPVTPADRVATPVRPASQLRLPVAAPAYHPPAAVVRPVQPVQPQTVQRRAPAVPAYHPPAAATQPYQPPVIQRPAPAAPAYHPPAAPAYHPPAAAPRPYQAQPVQRPAPAAPAYHPPAAVVRPAPVRPAPPPRQPAAQPHPEHTPPDH
jgi:hypothetical protein